MRLSTREFIGMAAVIGIIGSIYSVVVNGDDPAVIQFIFWPSVGAAVASWVCDTCRNP